MPQSIDAIMAFVRSDSTLIARYPQNTKLYTEIMEYIAGLQSSVVKYSYTAYINARISITELAREEPCA